MGAMFGLIDRWQPLEIAAFFAYCALWCGVNIAFLMLAIWAWKRKRNRH